MKKLLSLWFLYCITTIIGSAQIITPTVVSSAGDYSSGGGISLSYTVGDLSVSTGTGGGVVLTQGFQQPSSVTKKQSSSNPPTITINGSLSAFSTSLGTPSNTQTFTISGSNLTANISLSAPTHFEISTSSSSGFGSSLSLTPSNGTVSSTTIYVRYNPSSSGSHNGNISASSSGASTQTIAVSGSTTSSPIIYVNASINSFSTSVGTPSSSQTFTVSGVNLQGNIILNAPTHFEISKSASSGYNNSLSLTPTSGSVSSTTIYVRYNPSSSGSHSGNIDVSSTNASTQYISLYGSTGSASPTITTSVNNLSAFTTSVGTPSTSKSFTVSGVNLTGTLYIDAPSEFEVSLNSSTGFGASVSLTPSSGKVSNTTIYVRYNPSTSGPHSGTVDCSSSGANTESVWIYGLTGTNIPTIIVSKNSLNAFSSTVGSPSSTQTFTISGTDLADDIDIFAPTHFEISLNSSSGFSGALTLSQTSGSVSNTTIYVRYNPSNAGPHNDDIECGSLGANYEYIAVSGTTTSSGTPTLTTSVSSLNAFTTQVGTPSTVQSFTVSGNNLNGLVVVSAPADFQVSLNSTSNFGGSVYFTPNSGIITNEMVYVRYNPTTAGSHNGNISCASAGATSVNVSISGTSTMPAGPVITATNIANIFNTTVGIPSTVQAMIVNGSKLTSDITITSPAPFEVSLQAGSGFTSSLNLTPVSGTVNNTIIYVRYNPTAAGTHSGGIVLTSNGANSQTIQVNGISSNTGIIENSYTPFSIYPNPANDLLNIIYQTQNIPTFKIYDMNGRLIQTRPNYNNQIIQINTQELSNGLYIMNIEHNNSIYSMKFEIIH